MDKKDYLSLKKHLMSLCLDEINELADKVGLSEYERKLLIHLNHNETRIATCMELGCCEKKYTTDLRRALGKIFNFLKRTNNN